MINDIIQTEKQMLHDCSHNRILKKRKKLDLLKSRMQSDAYQELGEEAEGGAREAEAHVQLEEKKKSLYHTAWWDDSNYQ